MTLPTLFNPFDPQYIADPHAFYARLRGTGPVQRATLPDGRAVWLLTGYAEVEAAFAGPRLVKEPRSAGTASIIAWGRHSHGWKVKSLLELYCAECPTSGWV